MLCPICRQRKAKRACPASGKQICTVCCGTKRLVEISCPPTCSYLVSSRAHPPAVVQRQQEMDRAMLLPLLQGLSERQARVFLTFGAVIARHQGEVLQKLLDDDIAQATAALAATLETAGRGILYEHQPPSLPAARLMTELKVVVEEVAKNAGSSLERDAAIALRRIEHAAKMMAGAAAGNSARRRDSEFQQLLARVLSPPPGSEQTDEPAAPPSSLIIP